MKCGVRFCGGCNPRYDRGKALKALEEKCKGKTDFVIAEEEVLYDLLLIIGGCSSCCASYEQFITTGGVIKMWDEIHIAEIAERIKKM
ncbi:hypothetical protein [Aminipila luticellarii]|uniref:Uncharacterized protein n=1 Tax=Aminipila luticellarii TaxID=2507160 RepID=A0A410PVZ6_9FIRM|nr:hypothetical protein [Aminipila luticellarii]QAT43109.1 hypothetical protein EQM06_07590 [Aminipila luticellarii]